MENGFGGLQAQNLPVSQLWPC